MQPVVSISKSNLVNNYNYVKTLNGNVSIFGVVKANAYGHGVIQVCNILDEAGIDGFCVALISEVRNLRNNGINNKILHIGKFNYQDLELFSDGDTYCTINSIDDINCIEKFIKDTQKTVYAHIKFDTGMIRMGSYFESHKEVIDVASRLNNLVVHGLFSHLADADGKTNTFMDKQLDKFNIIRSYAESRLKDLKYIHIGNSSTLLKNYKHKCNAIRLGISLYGINPLGEINNNLKPAMKFFAPVVAIKDVKKGDSIGYNRKFMVEKDMKVGMIQAGYADGVPTQFCNTCFVDYSGTLLKVLGKVSMDLFCIDCSETNIEIGENVIIWGGENNRIEHHSKLIKKNLYTYTTKIGNRVKYIYEI